MQSDIDLLSYMVRWRYLTAPQVVAGPMAVIMRGRSKGGYLHFYYFCLGRQRHTCDLPYLHLARVENVVLDHYSTITLPGALRDQITARMDAVLTDSAGPQRGSTRPRRRPARRPQYPGRPVP